MPSLFNDWFLFRSGQNNYKTSWFSLGSLHKPSYKTNIYGKNSIIVSAIKACNNPRKLLKISLRHLFPNKIKKKKKIVSCLFCKLLKWIVNFQILQIDARWFSNFARSIFVLPFSSCCCYFIMYIFLSGLSLIYWTKLLLLSTQVLLHEIVPIQSKVWVDSFT